MLLEYIRQINKYRKKLRKLKQVSKRLGVPLVDFEMLRSKKDSETVFILANGPSINDISLDEWQHIGTHDTIGLNMWPLHDFVPKVLMFEIPSNSIQQKVFLDCLAARACDYRATEILMHDASEESVQKIQRLHNVDFRISYFFPFAPADDLILYLRKFSFFSRLYQYRIIHVPFEIRASVFRAVTLAGHIGYKNIVLAGVDLNRPGYFYDQRSVQGFVSNPNEIHSTNNPDHCPLTVSRALLDAQSLLLNRLSAKILIYSPCSALSKDFPLYWDK